MYLSLCLSVILLSAALGFGMCALWVGVLAVYPQEYVNQDVWVPFAVSSFMMLVAFVILMIRPLLLFPGWPALYKAVTMDPLWVGAVNIVPYMAWLLWSCAACVCTCWRGTVPRPVRRWVGHCMWHMWDIAQWLMRSLQRMWQWVKRQLQHVWQWLKQLLQHMC